MAKGNQLLDRVVRPLSPRQCEADDKLWLDQIKVAACEEGNTPGLAGGNERVL